MTEIHSEWEETTGGQRQRLPELTLILVPVARGQRPNSHDARDAQARMHEAEGLVRAIELDVADNLIVPLSGYRPSTLFGAGKVAELAALIEAKRIGLVVVDHALSPVQQRNLERAWTAKVIDRTGLILEIFGDRARTREGRLQVELAHLTYHKSRLVRSWTHLERQRGGFGFLGGPGETQIEADRRAISERIDRIKQELDAVATRRRLQRKNRRRSGDTVVALVGYTNAGKSTLFNALTMSGVFADDRLFATLDPTLRHVRLPKGQSIVLSDTVGFVSDLPTSLIAAFRATLEEVIEADLILHVRDIADPDGEAQARDVAAILDDLGIDPRSPSRIIEVWNKIDLVDPKHRPLRKAGGNGHGTAPPAIAVSALSGEGLPALLAAIEERVTAEHRVFRVELAEEKLRDLHRLYDLGRVLDRDDRQDGITVARVRVSLADLARFRQTFPQATIAPRV